MVGATKSTKDLTTKKSSIQGGGHNLNDNPTLVRSARPTKKDLPAGKDVKGGKIALNDNITLVRPRYRT